jgi:acyl-CoA dehydrogenase
VRLPTWAQTIPFDEAVSSAFHAPNVAEAFFAGYQAALRSLVPALPAGKVAAFCATEQGGNHPRAIQTRLAEGRLSGHKVWVTGGIRCDVLLVVASAGTDAQGRNALMLVRLDRSRAGVEVRELPATPFVPEVPHAEVFFNDVAVQASEVLPGDGYASYVKPFRTVEDIHVHAAVVAYVLGIGGRFSWPAPHLERALPLLITARTLAEQDPSSPSTHLALAGLISQTRSWLDESNPHWAAVESRIRENWLRDQPLLRIAEKAREQRTERARGQ